MGKAPMPPAKKPKTTAADRVKARYNADFEELAPGIVNRAMFGRKYGDGFGIPPGKRAEVADAMVARNKRDTSLVDDYGQDAYKAKSFMSERPPAKMKNGGKVEGSAKDMREDKAMAKKAGVSMAKWEKSAADKKHDAPKKMAGGGMCGPKKMVTGGTVARGMGAAKRGGAFGKNG